MCMHTCISTLIIVVYMYVYFKSWYLISIFIKSNICISNVFYPNQDYLNASLIIHVHTKTFDLY